MANGPTIHGVIGVQGGSGATLVAALLAIEAADRGEHVLLVPRPGDDDILRLYLGMGNGVARRVSRPHRPAP